MKNVVLGIIAVGALAGAVYLMLNRGGATGDDAAEGMDQSQVWVCGACAAENVMTKRQSNDRMIAGSFGCTACQSKDLRPALYCTNPNCGRAIITTGHGRLPPECPSCHIKFGEWADIDESVVLPPPG